jgi:hypothetical protein
MSEREARKRELEAAARDQDAKHKEREERTLEELGGLLDAAVEQEADRLSVPIAAQFKHLEKRLRDLDLLSDDDEFDRRYYGDRGTGDVIVGIEVDGLLYTFGGIGAGDLLIVRRIIGGRSEVGLLGENGEEPTRWYLTSPPGGNAATN